jgi:hypothetical protein
MKQYSVMVAAVGLTVGTICGSLVHYSSKSAKDTAIAWQLQNPDCIDTLSEVWLPNKMAKMIKVDVGGVSACFALTATFVEIFSISQDQKQEIQRVISEIIIKLQKEEIQRCVVLEHLPTMIRLRVSAATTSDPTLQLLVERLSAINGLSVECREVLFRRITADLTSHEGLLAKHEKMIVMFLDSKGTITGLEMKYRGGLATSMSKPGSRYSHFVEFAHGLNR